MCPCTKVTFFLTELSAVSCFVNFSLSRNIFFFFFFKAKRSFCVSVPYVSSTFDDNPVLRSGFQSARSSTRGSSGITHPMFLGAPVMPLNRQVKNARTTKPSGQHHHGYIAHPGHHNRVNGHPITGSMPSLPTTSSGHYTSGSFKGEANLPANSKPSGAPAAPGALQVQRVVGQHSLLLAWKAPLMDELARSQGAVVKGYRLHIDGREKQDLPSPHLTKALVEHLNLRKPHDFRIQTVSITGVLSPPVAARYEGRGRQHGEDDGDSAAGDGDVSSIFSGSVSGSAAGDPQHERRVFMALYNYNPQSQSPHKPNTSDELPLVAGDILTTYGPQRPDGFYHAKVFTSFLYFLRQKHPFFVSGNRIEGSK